MPLRRIGVVGAAGKMGGNHVAALSDLRTQGYLEFPAVSDAYSAAEYTFKEKHPELRFYISCEEMIRKERLDGVVIAVPADSHVKVGKEVVDSGCRYGLMEKPFVPLRRIEQGPELLDYAKGRTKFMSGTTACYEPVLDTFIDNEDVVGKIREVVSFRIGYVPLRMLGRAGVDPLDDLGLHDAMNFRRIVDWREMKIMGNSAYKTLMGFHKNYYVYSAATLDGVAFTSTSAWIPGNHQMRVTYVVGDRTIAELDYVSQGLGYIPFDVAEKIRTQNMTSEILGMKELFTESLPVRREPDALRKELLEFVKFIETDGRETLTPAERELETLQQMWPVIAEDLLRDLNKR